MLTCGSLKVNFLNNYRWQVGVRGRPKDRPRGCRIICTYNWQGNQQREWDRVSCILTGFRLKWLITSKASVSLATSSGYCGVVYCRGPGPRAWGDAVMVASSFKSYFLLSLSLTPVPFDSQFLSSFTKASLVQKSQCHEALEGIFSYLRTFSSSFFVLVFVVTLIPATLFILEVDICCFLFFFTLSLKKKQKSSSFLIISSIFSP